jgi:hypothetical protein
MIAVDQHRELLGQIQLAYRIALREIQLGQVDGQQVRASEAGLTAGR